MLHGWRLTGKPQNICGAVPDGPKMIVDDVLEQLPPHLQIGGRRGEVGGLVARIIAAAAPVPPRSEASESTVAAWSNQEQTANQYPSADPGDQALGALAPSQRGCRGIGETGGC